MPTGHQRVSRPVAPLFTVPVLPIVNFGLYFIHSYLDLSLTVVQYNLS